MADVKISALPAATTPLAGTEVLPIVQSNTTKKVAISDVTAGRAISASSLTLTTPLAVGSGGTGATATTGTGNNVLSTSPVLTTPAIIGSSTGKTTIASANSGATDYTLTLPAKTGNIITSADSGTVTQAMIASNVAGNGPVFSAYQSSAQSISSATFTKLQFQAEEFDTNSNYDNTTNYRFTPTVAGYYQFSAGFAVASSATTGMITFYKNGSEFKRGGYNTATSALNGITMSAIIYCNGSTDYVEAWGYIGTGQNTNASQTTTYFQGALVRAA